MAMASTSERVRNAVKFSAGFGVGAGGTAVVGAGVAKGVGAILHAAPAIAPAAGLAARALPVVGGVVVVGGALYGGYQAYRHGQGAGGVLGGAVLGAVGISPAYAEGKKKRRKDDEAPARGDETSDQARERLGRKFGGTPNDIRLAAENDRANMAKADTPQKRDAYERRALLAEQEYERQTGQHIGPTAGPAATAPAPNGMMKTAADALGVVSHVLGLDQASPFAQRRAEIKSQIEFERDQSKKEYDKNPGEGPNQQKHRSEIERLQGELGKIDAEERKAPSAYKTGLAVGMSLGAALLGYRGGHAMSEAAISGAEASAKIAGKGVEALSMKAAALADSAPRGVLARTVAGDKAMAVVTSARAAIAQTHVNAATFILPGISLAAGGASIAYSAANPDSEYAGAARAEGIATTFMGLYGLKGAVTAYGVATKVGPQALARLESATNRLAREMTRGGGPAGVAQARGRRAVAVASGRAGVAQAEGRSAVGLASTRGQAAVGVAGHQATGRLASAKHGADVRAVTSGSRVGVAKAEGAARVERAEIRGKQSASRLMANGERLPKYKDTWQDSRGRVYHRKDMGVRKPGRSGAANDNRGGSRAAGRG